MRKLNDNFSALKKLILLGFAIFFLFILFFEIRWQLVLSKTFSDQAAQRIRQRTSSSIRGDIIARNGETLAFSVPRWDVFVYLIDVEEAERPTDINPARQTREEFVRKVSSILGKSPEEISDRLNSGPSWVKIADNIDIDTKKQLEELKTDRNEYKRIIGLNYEITADRIYPEKELASHVIGFLGLDYNGNASGRGGIEQQYNGALEPQEGFVVGETDSQGNLIAISDSVSIKAKRGSTIKTTIDKQIQKLAERKAKEGVERFDSLSASIIVMDPKTGEILAMANYPTYNPGEYNKVEDISYLSNRAIVSPYEPGSVQKILTLAAAVEELGIGPGDIILEGHDGCRTIQASNYKEDDVREICTADKKPQGPLTAVDALVKSDNLAFATLAEMLGNENFHHYLSNFGIGKATGIDVSGESIGLLPDLDNPNAWHPVDRAVFSYGHGVESNLLQITRAIAAVANDGWLMQPYVVSEILDEGETVRKYEPIPVEKVISTETSSKVSTMVHEVFKSQTGLSFRNLAKYPIAGKSGSALIPNREGPGYTSDINATYIGYDMSEERNFIIAVKLEAPQAVEKLSYYSARPIWMEMLGELVEYYGMEPEE